MVDNVVVRCRRGVGGYVGMGVDLKEVAERVGTSGGGVGCGGDLAGGVEDVEILRG